MKWLMVMWIPERKKRSLICLQSWTSPDFFCIFPPAFAYCFPWPFLFFYVSLCFMFRVLFQLGAMCEGEPG